MLTAITPRAIILICLFIAVYMPGCMAFSDSSAMRIEVEVYKGPLSLEPEIQLGELFGYLREAYNGLQKTQDIIQAVGKTNGLYSCPSGSKLDRNGYDTCTLNPKDQSNSLKSDQENKANSPLQWCSSLDPSNLNFFSKFDYADCSLLKMLSEDVSKLQNSLLHPICALTKAISTDTTCDITNDSLDTNTLKMLNNSLKKIQISSITLLQTSLEKSSPPIQESSLRDALMEANRAVAVMQASAFRYANAATGGRSTKFSVRKAQTHFIAATSEYANQIQARADALLKQLGNAGRDRRELPLSTHLREAEPTDFVYLYSWMSSTTPSIFPLLVFSPPQMSVTERIKVVDRLYADHFWSKINTVYASGRGKTQMAFIKDETGNWNLKSFHNDPTELLEAYTNVAQKALQKAAALATGTFTGGISAADLVLAKQLRDFAADSEPDKAISQTPPAGTLSLTHLRTRLMDKLDPAQFKSDLEKEKELLGTIDKQTAAVATATDSAKNAAQKDLADTQNELMNHRKQVIARWETIFTDHSNLVDILSSTIKKN